MNTVNIFHCNLSFFQWFRYFFQQIILNIPSTSGKCFQSCVFSVPSTLGRSLGTSTPVQSLSTRRNTVSGDSKRGLPSLYKIFCSCWLYFSPSYDIFVDVFIPPFLIFTLYCAGPFLYCHTFFKCLQAVVEIFGLIQTSSKPNCLTSFVFLLTSVV